jgi:hypothetical protein
LITFAGAYQQAIKAHVNKKNLHGQIRNHYAQAGRKHH